MDSRSVRGYPLPPEAGDGSADHVLIGEVAQVFPRHGRPELSTGDLSDLAAAVQQFMYGHRPQVDDRLARDPQDGQCPRCWARHGGEGSPVRALPGDVGYECARCDRRFGVHAAGTADGAEG